MRKVPKKSRRGSKKRGSEGAECDWGRRGILGAFVKEESWGERGISKEGMEAWWRRLGRRVFSVYFILRGSIGYVHIYSNEWCASVRARRGRER